MKRTYLIFILSLAFSALFAQQKPRVEEMHARKWDYIAEKMQFNAQQVTKIQPLFMEFESAVWKTMEKNRDAYRKFNRDKQRSTQPNFEDINDSFVDSEMQKAQLLKTYYQKLKKYLTAEQIYSYFDAERSFRKELIRDWQGKGRRQPQP